MKQLLIICLFLLSNILFAQSYKVKYATDLTNRLQYTEAYPVWEELAAEFLKSNKGEFEYIRMAVKTAQQSEQFDKAFYWDSLLLVTATTTDTSDWIKYFNLLCLTNRHYLLPYYTETATQKFPNCFSILNWKKQTPTILNNLSDTGEYQVTLLRPKSKAEEYSLVPYKKSQLYVTNEYKTGFLNTTYLWTGQNYSNISYIKDPTKPEQKFSLFDHLFNKDIWTEIKPIKAHDGPIAFSKNYRTAVITRNQSELNPESNVKFSRLELKIYHYKNGDWIEDSTFTWNNKQYSTGHGTFDHEGNLIFISDKPGGFGGTDLYKSVRKNNKWTEPINMGARVNTSLNEMFPHVNDTGTLIFASNGWPGIGGLDLFWINPSDNTPSAFKIPINSTADDFALLFLPNGTGYMSSNRNEYKDQLYKIGRSLNSVTLEVVLITCNEQVMKHTQLLMRDQSTQKDTILITDDEGKIVLQVNPKSKNTILYTGDSIYSSDSIYFTSATNGYFQRTITTYKNNPILSFTSESSSKLPVKGGVMLNFYTDNTKIESKLGSDNGSLVWLQSGGIRCNTIVANYINHEDKVIKIAYSNDYLCNDTISYKLNFKQKKRKEFVNLDLILYDFDKYFLRPESKDELEKLVNYMNEHPDLIVELSSHTDSRGTFAYNETLSQNRSQSCVNYIISLGIHPDKIIAKGYGEYQLLNRCADDIECSREEHQLNRRTELKLLVK
jgi:outer membrane protein OmpA-like peptidoglycan-associated protein